MDKKKILVADDDDGIVEAMTILLEDEGYDVVTSMTGVEIPLLLKEKPDMIFLDIWMSGIDGRDVCNTIKANEQTRHIPVVMFSANKDTRDIANQCGADDFISKPFEMEDLIKMARKYTATSVA
jgi:CheY-like chemotaxis protein